MKKKIIYYFLGLFTILLINKSYCLNITNNIKDSDNIPLPAINITQDITNNPYTICSNNSCGYNNQYGYKYYYKTLKYKPNINDYTILINEHKSIYNNLTTHNNKYIDILILADSITYKSYNNNEKTIYIKNNNNTLQAFGFANYLSNNNFNNNVSYAITTIRNNNFNNIKWNGIYYLNENTQEYNKINSSIQLYTDNNYEEIYTPSSSQLYYTYGNLWFYIRLKYNYNTNEYEEQWNSLNNELSNSKSRPYLNSGNNNPYTGNSNIEIQIGEFTNYDSTHRDTYTQYNNLLFTTKKINLYNNTSENNIPQWDSYYTNSIDYIYKFKKTIENNSYLNYNYHNNIQINNNDNINYIKYKFNLNESINNEININIDNLYYQNLHRTTPQIYIEKKYNDNRIRIENLTNPTQYQINQTNTGKILVGLEIPPNDTNNFNIIEDTTNLNELNLIINLNGLNQYTNNWNIGFYTNTSTTRETNNYNQYIDLTNKYGIILNGTIENSNLNIDRDIYNNIGLKYNNSNNQTYDIKILEGGGNNYIENYLSKNNTITFSNKIFKSPLDQDKYILIINNQYGNYDNNGNPIQSGIYLDTSLYNYKVLDNPNSDTTIKNENIDNIDNQDQTIPNKDITIETKENTNLFDNIDFSNNKILILFTNIWNIIPNTLKTILITFITILVIIWTIKVIKK